MRADTDHHVVLVGPLHHGKCRPLDLDRLNMCVVAALLFIQAVLQSSELKQHTVLITVLQPDQVNHRYSQNLYHSNLTVSLARHLP